MRKSSFILIIFRLDYLKPNLWFIYNLLRHELAVIYMENLLTILIYSHPNITPHYILLLFTTKLIFNSFILYHNIQHKPYTSQAFSELFSDKSHITCDMRPVVTYKVTRNLYKIQRYARKTRRPTYFDNLKIIKKVLDLYRLLFVYSGLPVCGGV